jgi:hypothetical protein
MNNWENVTATAPHTNWEKEIGSLLPLREDLRAVLEVERGEVLAGEERPVVLVRRRQHRREQRAGACPGDHVEVVCNPSIRPIQLLQISIFSLPFLSI